MDADDWRIVITEQIKEEVKDMESKIFLRIALPQMSIIVPKKKYIKEVKEKSGESGGLHQLSEADVSLIALALQVAREEKGKVVVVSEDFMIQNYCAIWGLEFKSLRECRITEERIILKKCEGCGEEYLVKFSRCPSCGGEQFELIEKRKKD